MACLRSYSFHKELTTDMLKLFELCVTDPNFECKVGYEVIEAALDGRINMSKPFNLRGYQSAILSNNKKSKARQNSFEFSSDVTIGDDESTTIGDMLSDLDAPDEYELTEFDIDYDAAIKYFAKYNNKILKKHKVDVLGCIDDNLDKSRFAIARLRNLVEANSSIRSHVYALLEHGLDDEFYKLLKEVHSNAKD